MQEKTALEAEYEKIKNLGLSLDMSRGKPGADQLDLSLPMLDVLKSDSDMKSESGLDVRNYACLDGIPEAKALIAGMVGAKPEQAIVYGNSSLNIMYDQVSRAFIFGLCGLTHVPMPLEAISSVRIFSTSSNLGLIRAACFAI